MPPHSRDQSRVTLLHPIQSGARGEHWMSTASSMSADSNMSATCFGEQNTAQVLHGGAGATFVLTWRDGASFVLDLDLQWNSM